MGLLVVEDGRVQQEVFVGPGIGCMRDTVDFLTPPDSLQSGQVE